MNVTYTSTFYGDTADVTCQDRYIPVTGALLSGSITCSGSGSWTDSGVKCEWGGKAHNTNIHIIALMEKIQLNTKITNTHVLQHRNKTLKDIRHDWSQCLFTKII